ncbi:hypothetical protein L7F22_021248 [Adiantum nelumboides]|nr:hypothetical protein [Adiantum nelumboides]
MFNEAPVFTNSGGEEKFLEFLEKKVDVASRNGRDVAKAAVQHPFPLKFLLAPWSYGDECFKILKFGIVQYMIMKTLCALLSLILELCGVYGDGEFQWNYGYPYITVAMNFSQMWALYCLVQFYNTAYEELKPIKPLLNSCVSKLSSLPHGGRELLLHYYVPSKSFQAQWTQTNSNQACKISLFA